MNDFQPVTSGGNGLLESFASAQTSARTSVDCGLVAQSLHTAENEVLCTIKCVSMPSLDHHSSTHKVQPPKKSARYKIHHTVIIGRHPATDDAFRFCPFSNATPHLATAIAIHPPLSLCVDLITSIPTVYMFASNLIPLSPSPPSSTMAAPDVQHQAFPIDHHHCLQEFVLPEALRYDTPFDNFTAENQFPVIDLADLDGAGSHEEVMAKLVRAAETWGFFKVVNHGVPHEVIQNTMAHMEKFFARPIEEKMRVKSDYPRNFEGYTPGNLIVDADGRHLCWSERLNFEREGNALQALAEQVWREDDGQVRSVQRIDALLDCCPIEGLFPTGSEWLWRSQDLLQYMEHMDSLSHRLIGLLSEGIAGDSSQKFKASHDSTSGHFSAAHYPPCPRPDLARGIRVHTDPHSLAILYQEYPGLQLLKDGKWLAVKPEVGTLVVNVGDMLQIWSNGQYRSVQHQVALNSTTSRFSLIFFKNPYLYEIISTPAKLVNEVHPRKYKDVSYKEYLILIQNRVLKVGFEKIAIA